MSFYVNWIFRSWEDDLAELRTVRAAWEEDRGHHERVWRRFFSIIIIFVEFFLSELKFQMKKSRLRQTSSIINEKLDMCLWNTDAPGGNNVKIWQNL